MRKLIHNPGDQTAKAEFIEPPLMHLGERSIALVPGAAIIAFGELPLIMWPQQCIASGRFKDRALHETRLNNEIHGLVPFFHGCGEGGSKLHCTRRAARDVRVLVADGAEFEPPGTDRDPEIRAPLAQNRVGKFGRPRQN